MTKQEILNELERIKDGLQDSDGMGKFGVDGACDDLEDDIIWENKMKKYKRKGK